METGRSLVFRSMHSKCLSCEKQVEAKIIKEIDEALLASGAKKSIMNAEMVQNLLKQLKVMEIAITEIEDCLEPGSRC